MNKLLKKIVVLVIVATSVFSFGGCRASYQFKEGNGKTLEFEEAEQLACIVDYKYSEQEESYWDYYSVEYEMNTFLYEGNYYDTYNGIPVFVEIADIQEVKVHGAMAHSEGIYYIQEKMENVTVELLVDTVYNAYAISLGNKFAKQFKKQVEMYGEDVDDFLVEDWFCWVGSNGRWGETFDDKVKELLKTAEYFYDYEFLSFYKNNSDKFKQRKATYMVQELNANEREILAKSFKDKHKLNFKMEFKEVSGKIDLSKSKSPVVEFSYEIYIPSIEESAEFSGKLNYNYVNNTVIVLPQSVKQLWAQDEGYLRYKSKQNDFSADLDNFPDWMINFGQKN